MSKRTQDNIKGNRDQEIAEWVSYLTTLGVSATLGGMIGANQCGGPMRIGEYAALGSALAASDELLIKNKLVTGQHYFTSTALYGAMFYPWVRKIADNSSYKLPIYSIAVVSALAIPYFTADAFNYKQRVEEPVSAILTLDRVAGNHSVIKGFIIKTILELAKTCCNSYIAKKILLDGVQLKMVLCKL
ncbi:hypothetical protein Trichorick_00562 [Candidatus Trichorickettsia mobilis]|uniref:Uncharacterized protein n=1 Tax=Candidatus Trichorickettsia mobilis TaxID=1346319 RepID=A0ABZ0URL5_9RICK|nr:hypothetical protein [Candidatus Trichorickettsia mobilis]WPY00678.1 hypothetical protein Trichorick_00562 [Candidatus Trichorickettsia mobilis]